jgi:hypothetical protein
VGGCGARADRRSVRRRGWNRGNGPQLEESRGHLERLVGSGG